MKSLGGAWRCIGCEEEAEEHARGRRSKVKGKEKAERSFPRQRLTPVSTCQRYVLPVVASLRCLLRVISYVRRGNR
jgi:hypothetical protein